MALSNEVKIKIIEGKLEVLEAQYYSAQLEMEVAEDVGSERIADHVKGDMVEIKKAQRFLEKKLAVLEKDGE